MANTPTTGDDVITGTSSQDYIDALAGADIVFGGEGDDVLQGGAGDDQLYGQGGSDVLRGGADADRMEGGDGNDYYEVNNVGDIVVEGDGVNSGIDWVYSSIVGSSYTLTANVENLVLRDVNNLSLDLDGTGNNLDNLMFGNDGKNKIDGAGGNDQIYAGGGNDILLGGEGNDYLDGGAGNDKMTGGNGNDIYVVDSSSDLVNETAGATAGIDKVLASVNYALGANIENLSFFSGANLSGVGNELDNVINGWTGNNILYGMGGNDTINGWDGNDSLFGNDGKDILNGGEGNDLLNGGIGADTMDGGNGDDMYVVDDSQDVVKDSGTGFDTVYSTATSFSLADTGAEMLVLKDGAINAYGDDGANYLYGNSANNVLYGGRGNDYLNGGAGDDWFSFKAASDNGKDFIADFTAGDKLVFDSGAYGGLKNATIDSHLSHGSAAVGSGAQFFVEDTSHTLYYDADGAGGAAATAVAQFGNGHSVVAGDFNFIL